LRVAALYEHWILCTATGNHLDGEVCLVVQELGHARGDRVPAAADGAPGPGERSLGEGSGRGHAKEDGAQHEDRATPHAARPPPVVMTGRIAAQCRSPGRESAASP